MNAEGVSTALTTVWELVGSCVDFIGKNPVLMVLFVAGLVPMGFRIFKRAKNSVK